MARQATQQSLTYTILELQGIFPAGEWVSTFNASFALRAHSEKTTGGRDNFTIKMATVRDLFRSYQPTEKIIIAQDAIYKGNDEYLFVDDDVRIPSEIACAYRQLEFWESKNNTGMINIFQCRLDALKAYMEHN